MILALVSAGDLMIGAGFGGGFSDWRGKKKSPTKNWRGRSSGGGPGPGRRAGSRNPNPLGGLRPPRPPVGFFRDGRGEIHLHAAARLHEDMLSLFHAAAWLHEDMFSFLFNILNTV